MSQYLVDDAVVARDMLCDVITLLDVCVSSLRGGHTNIICIVPISTDDPRRESKICCATSSCGMPRHRVHRICHVLCYLSFVLVAFLASPPLMCIKHVCCMPLA